MNWDDLTYIQANPYLKDFSWHGFLAIFIHPYFSNYHPITTFSWWLEYNVLGDAPMHFHIINLLLHCTNVLLLFFLIIKLFKSQWIATIVALLFSIHPMHVESVAWIAERKDVLYVLFYFIGLLIYLKYIETLHYKRLLWFTYLFFMLSLLSKPAALTFPFILVLIDWFYNNRSIKSSIIEKLPMFILLLCGGIAVTFLQLQHHNILKYLVIHKLIIGLFTTSFSFVSYVFKFLIPFHLSSLHPIQISWMYYISPLIVIALLWLFYSLAKQSRIIAFGVSFFLITIALFIKYLPVGDVIIAERYVYLANIGLYIIVGFYFKQFYDKYFRFRFLILNVGVLVIVLFSILTFQRTKNWKDGETLFSNAISVYPDYFKSYAIRAIAFERDRNYSKALNDYNTCLQLNPTYAKAYNNRALIYFKLNDIYCGCGDVKTALNLGFPVKSTISDYCLKYQLFLKDKKALQTK